MPIEDILEAQQREIEKKREKERLKLKALQERGMAYHVETTQDDF